MPPEIIFGKTHTSKADIWSLGILLYEMLHGHPPYSADTLDMIKVEFDNKQIEIYSCFSQDARNILKDLLKTDPLKRPDINQLLNHPTFLKNLNAFSQPFSKEEYNLMMKNYFKNTDGGRDMEIPEAANLVKSEMVVNTSPKNEPGKPSSEMNPDTHRSMAESNFFADVHLSSIGQQKSEKGFFDNLPSALQDLKASDFLGTHLTKIPMRKSNQKSSHPKNPDIKMVSLNDDDAKHVGSFFIKKTSAESDHNITTLQSNSLSRDSGSPPSSLINTVPFNIQPLIPNPPQISQSIQPQSVVSNFGSLPSKVHVEKQGSTHEIPPPPPLLTTTSQANIEFKAPSKNQSSTGFSHQNPQSLVSPMTSQKTSEEPSIRPPLVPKFSEEPNTRTNIQRTNLSGGVNASLNVVSSSSQNPLQYTFTQNQHQGVSTGEATSKNLTMTSAQTSFSNIQTFQNTQPPIIQPQQNFFGQPPQNIQSQIQTQTTNKSASQPSSFVQAANQIPRQTAPSSMVTPSTQQLKTPSIQQTHQVPPQNQYQNHPQAFQQPQPTHQAQITHQNIIHPLASKEHPANDLKAHQILNQNLPTSIAHQNQLSSNPSSLTQQNLGAFSTPKPQNIQPLTPQPKNSIPQPEYRNPEIRTGFTHADSSPKPRTDNRSSEFSQIQNQINQAPVSFQNPINNQISRNDTRQSEIVRNLTTRTETRQSELSKQEAAKIPSVQFANAFNPNGQTVVSSSTPVTPRGSNSNINTNHFSHDKAMDLFKTDAPAFLLPSHSPPISQNHRHNQPLLQNQTPMLKSNLSPARGQNTPQSSAPNFAQTAVPSNPLNTQQIQHQNAPQANSPNVFSNYFPPPSPQILTRTISNPIFSKSEEKSASEVVRPSHPQNLANEAQKHQSAVQHPKNLALPALKLSKIDSFKFAAQNSTSTDVSNPKPFATNPSESKDQANMPKPMEPPNMAKFKYVVINGILIKKPSDEDAVSSQPKQSIPKSFSAGQYFDQSKIERDATQQIPSTFLNNSKIIKINEDLKGKLGTGDASLLNQPAFSFVNAPTVSRSQNLDLGKSNEKMGGVAASANFGKIGPFKI